ncbi:MAG TPA: cyclic nucleotide-binding domain-containing protein [Gemmataceae bacterium]|nr:cyclic nucleotide-binding domain-containing protein [Gemmataceae bacterium]
MILTLERVLLLKQVEMFAAVDDDVLAGLAARMQEREGVPGEALLRQGEMGQELYVVVSGRVRVQRGEQTLAELGPRGVIGELAALDPAPRTATVTVLEPTLLLSLDHADLAEELLSNSDLAWGIIRFLVRRFRDPTR